MSQNTIKSAQYLVKSKSLCKPKSKQANYNSFVHIVNRPKFKNRHNNHCWPKIKTIYKDLIKFSILYYIILYYII